VNIQSDPLRQTVKILCAGALFALVLSGCASTGGPPGPAASTPGPAGVVPPITVIRTGGIAGVHDTLHVDATGAWTLTNKAGVTKNGTFTAADLAALAPLASDPRLLTEATVPPPATKCRDAFNYAVAIAGMHISYTDCPTDPTPEATVALVQKLFAIVAG
jgi:hypothetical protein